MMSWIFNLCCIDCGRFGNGACMSCLLGEVYFTKQEGCLWYLGKVLLRVLDVEDTRLV